MTSGDGRQLRALLGAYLRMSLRGKAAGTFFQGGKGKWRGTLALMVVYLVMGTAIAIGASGSGSPFSYALAMHTVTFVMLGMSLAAEAGDLLFHPGEQEVLGHLAIAPRTLLVAKAGSLMGFALMVAFAINLPALVVGAWQPWLPGAFLVVHPVAIALLTAFAAGILVFSYGLVVSVVGRERFDNAAAWSQAGLSGTFLVLSQGVSNLWKMPIMGLDASFCLYFPPAWFAALDLLGAGSYSTRAVGMSVVAIATTGTLAWAALTRLAPGYGQAFARLAEAQTPRASVEISAPASLGLARWWLANPVERAAFRLARTYMRRDREVKTRLYPSLGFFLLLPVAQLIGSGHNRFIAAAILSVILIGLLPSIVLEALRVSSHHIAAEVFATTPIGSAGPLFHGVRKAVTWYVILPATAVAVVWVVVLDPSVLPLTLPNLIALPFMTLLPGAFRDYVPLSVQPAAGRQSLTNILIGMLVALIGGVTVVASRAFRAAGYLPHFIAAELIVVVAGSWLLSRAIARRPFSAPSW